jgi:flavin-dependent dehydrogenase
MVAGEDGTPSTRDFDVIIVGAGCIGSAAARHVAAATPSVCLIGAEECRLDPLSPLDAPEAGPDR